ncbi:fluoride efflux transporter FluC [Arthrobacter sp. RIT-PI-e]|uniref:fluoride efflux transporter FluC n=1 Tax=Arthrobacter sp. RIT-PI-e TaxID=1681197 RepID=UPI000AFC1DF5|nr:CrcB family protein [Arthrobacter sp. RIT-PI-e]
MYLLLVFLGGSAGTLTRYSLAEVLPTPRGLPLGIFVINVVGAFALGLLLEALLRHGPDEGRRRALRLVLGTGFLGGFTTYSALTVDAALLLEGGRILEGIGYLLLTVVVGLGATTAGILLGGRAAGRRATS